MLRNGASGPEIGPDFGRTATGKSPKLAIRPAFGRPEGRFQCLPGSSPAKIRPGSRNRVGASRTHHAYACPQSSHMFGITSPFFAKPAHGRSRAKIRVSTLQLMPLPTSHMAQVWAFGAKFGAKYIQNPDDNRPGNLQPGCFQVPQCACK